MSPFGQMSAHLPDVRCHRFILYFMYIGLRKTTTAQNEVALSYHRVRGLYFLAVIFAATIIVISLSLSFFLLS